jgi:hypothetical protein
MATAKHIIIVFALVLFSTQAAISNEPKLSNTRQASCVITIIRDYKIIPLSGEAITNLIYSSDVMEKALHEVLDSTIDKVNFSIKSEQRQQEADPFSIKLSVELKDGIKPAANEFLKALIKNLQTNLDNAFNTYAFKFNIQYETAMRNYNLTESELENISKNNKTKESATKFVITYSDLSEADKTVYKQLDQTVDLSGLSPEMTIAETLASMAHSVEPPLQIQVNWRDLVDKADITPETPAEIEPLNGIKLGKALNILLTGISNKLANIEYVVQGGVIVVATEDKLPDNFVTIVYDISNLINISRNSNTIKQAIQETIEPDSWHDRSDTGEGSINIILGNMFSIRQPPEIQQKIQNFLITLPTEMSNEPSESIPVDILNKDKQDLSRQKRSLELEIARLEARRSAAEQQIVGFNSKMQNKASLIVLQQNLAELVSKLGALKSTRGEQHSEVMAVQKQIDEIQKQIKSSQQDTITSELEQLIENQIQQLNSLKKQFEELRASQLVAPGPSKEIIEAEEKLARTKIELAKRREELARPAGIENLAALNENLSMALLDLAEKKAEFQVLEKQLSEIDSQIKAASTTDPKILKIRQARKAFEEAEKRLRELEQVKSNMQPPQVITIGIE